MTSTPLQNAKKKCQKSYKKSYQQDLYHGKSAYAVDASVEAIQKELMTNGPIEAAFEVYEDLLVYRSGVYQHHAGKLEGGHAVRMLGWGVENGTPYWLIANSWNSDWGEQGYFKILRGSDECGIESQNVAGLPRLNWTIRPKENRHRHHQMTDPQADVN